MADAFDVVDATDEAVAVRDVSLQVLVALRFYAKGCYEFHSGELHGISQPSVSRNVARVSEQIASLLPRYVSFPSRVKGLMTGFYRIARFPQVVLSDTQRRILDIVIGWQGSAHDARIWDSCSLKDEFEASRIKLLIFCLEISATHAEAIYRHLSCIRKLVPKNCRTVPIDKHASVWSAASANGRGCLKGEFCCPPRKLPS